jgi:hypothetical protein
MAVDGAFSPAVAFDPVGQRTLEVYVRESGSAVWVEAQLRDQTAQPIGPPVTLSDMAAMPLTGYAPAVVFSQTSAVYMVAWVDQRNNMTSGQDIYAQRVNAAGAPINSSGDAGIANFPLTLAGYNQHSPSAAWDDINNRFLFCWTDNRSSDANEIYGQLAGADGVLYSTTALENIFIGNAMTGMDAGPADTAFAPAAQRFLVVYEAETNQASSDILGALVSPDGSLYASPAGENFTICDNAAAQYEPSVAYDFTSLKFLVAWEDWRAGSETNIYGQIISPEGAPYFSGISDNFVISNAFNNQYSVELVLDPANSRFLAVWMDYRDNGVENIYSQLVGADATLYTTASGENHLIAGAGVETRPSAVFGAGRFYINWQDNATGQTGLSPSVQHVLYEPDPPPPIQRKDSDAAWNPNNDQYLAVYLAYEPGTYSWAVFGRFTDKNGAPLGAEFQISESHPDSAVACPRTVYAAGNPESFLVVWEDHRNQATTGADIYGQLVNAQGGLIKPGPYGMPGMENFPVSNAPGDQTSPDIVRGGFGWMLAVFEDNRNGEGDIYGQIIQADGTPYSSAVGANVPVSDKPGNQSQPSVIWDEVMLNYLVAFTHEADPGVYDVWGQFVNMEGNIWNLPTNVNFVISNAAGNQTGPVLAVNKGVPETVLLAAWTDNRDGEADIFGQTMDSWGALIGPASNVNFVISNAAGGQYNPKADWNEQCGEFLAAWTDARDMEADIYAQLVSAEAALLTTTSSVNFPVTMSTDPESQVAVAAGADGFFISFDKEATGAPANPDVDWMVRWASCHNGPPPPGYYRYFPGVAQYTPSGGFFSVYMAVDIYDNSVHVLGRLYGADGAPMGPEVELTDANANPPQPMSPRVAFSPLNGGSYLVVWPDLRNDTGTNNAGTDIFAQRVDINGSPILRSGAAGLDNFPVSEALYNQEAPALAVSSDTGRFLAVWQDNRDPAYSKIYGQMVESDGSLYSTTQLVNIPVANGPSNHYAPAVGWNADTGKYLVAFLDNRDGQTNTYIYGQVLDGDGNPFGSSTQDNFVISSEGSAKSGLSVGCGTDFLVAWASDRGAGGNIYGQFVNPEGFAETHPVTDNFVISDAPENQGIPQVLYDPFLTRYAIAFHSTGAGGPFLAVQFVSDDGTALVTPTNANRLVYKPESGLLQEFAASGISTTHQYFALAEDSTVPGGMVNLLFNKDFFLLNQPAELRLWYDYNSGVGSFEPDNSVFSNDAVLTDVTGVLDVSRLNGSAYFDGVAESLTNDSGSLDIEGPITLMAWIRPDDTDSIGGFRTLVGKMMDQDGYSYALVQYGGEIKFTLSSDGSGDGFGLGEVYVASPEVLNAGEWVHVAGVWDGADMFLYLNGMPAAGPVPFAGPIHKGASPVTVGYGAEYYKGALDEVKIFAGALTREQIAEEAGLTHQIHGMVEKQADGQPVMGTAVTAKGESVDWTGRASSGPDGSYTLDVLPGCYRVQALPPWDSGRFAVPFAPWVHTRGATEGGTPVDFALEGDGSIIQGRVEAYGGPAENAVVWYDSLETGPVGFTVTDAWGNYTLTNAPPGQGEAHVQKRDWNLADKSAVISVAGDMAGVNFEMQEGVCIVGRVMDAYGTPLDGITVEAEAAGGLVEATAVSDTMGWFTLCYVPAGYVELSTQRPADDNLVPGAPIGLVTPGPGGWMVLDNDLTMLYGARVQGAVKHPDNTPVSIGSVWAGGLDFSSEADVCGGTYELLLPAGGHLIFLEEFESASAMPMAASPVAITVDSYDAGYGNTIAAPDMVVFDQATGGSLDVTVVEGAWSSHGAPGTLRLLAVPEAYLVTPMEIWNFARLGVINSCYVPALGSPFNFGPLPPGPNTLAVVWERHDANGNGSGVVLGAQKDVAAVLPPAVSGATFWLGPDNSPVVQGRVVTDNQTPAAGATVLVTGPGGELAAYATSDANGDYTLYNLPASPGGVIYTFTAWHPNLPQLADVSTREYTAVSGVNGQVDNLYLLYKDPLNFDINTERLLHSVGKDVLVPADFAGYTLHEENQLIVRMDPEKTVMMLSPYVSYTPGRAVENVALKAQWNGWDDDEFLLPDAASAINTPAPYYAWYGLPDFHSQDMRGGIVLGAADSQTISAGSPVSLTRTVDVDNSAAAFDQWVTVEAVVHDPLVDVLYLDIHTGQTGITQSGFAPDSGLMEDPVNGETTVDNEDLTLNDRAFTRTIEKPVVGKTYFYKKKLTVWVQNNISTVYHKPRCSARAVSAPSALANAWANTGSLFVTDPLVGTVEITPANEVDWKVDDATRRETTAVVMESVVFEPAGVHPEVDWQAPAQGVTGVYPDATVEIGFTRPMNPDTLRLAIYDCWGNAVADTDRGIAGGDVAWTPDNLSLTFDPWEDFLPGTAYTVYVSGWAWSGQRILYDPGTTRWTFMTRPAPGDIVPPKEMAHTPHYGQTDAPLVSRRGPGSPFIAAQLSECVPPQAPSLVAFQQITDISGSVAANVPHAVEWAGSMVHVRPAAPLLPTTWYRVTLSGSIQDLSGNPMGTPVTWDFRTGSGAEPAPMVAPLPGSAEDADPWSNSLVLYCLKELDPATVTSANIYVKDQGGNVLAGAFDVEYYKASQGIRLYPSPARGFIPFDYGKIYKVCITNSVTDLLGQPVQGAAPGVPLEIPFRFTATHGNSAPMLWSVVDRLPQYPAVSRNADGVLTLDATVLVNDRNAVDVGTGNGGLNVMAEFGGYSGFFSTAGGLGWGIELNLESYPDETAEGACMLTVTTEDSAGHQVTYLHPVWVFPSGALTANHVEGWPFEISWDDVAGASVYRVEARDPAHPERVARAFFLPDVPVSTYTSELPPDTFGAAPPPVIEYRVLAFHSVDEPSGGWGFAATDWTAAKSDAEPPTLVTVSPGDQVENVNPRTPIQFRLADTGSGVNVDTLALRVNGVQVTDPATLTITVAHPYVDVRFDPALPYYAGAWVTVSLSVADNVDNVFNAPSWSFRVRDPITLNVPADYANIQAGLDAAAGGDTVAVAPGNYAGALILDARHSGVMLVALDLVNKPVIHSVAGIPGITVDQAHNALVQGFAITGGSDGVLVTNHVHSLEITECRIYGNSGYGVNGNAEGGVLLINNVLYGNGQGGVRVSDPGLDAIQVSAQLINNTLANNSNVGVLVDGDIYALIYHNILYQNGAYGLRFENGGLGMDEDYNIVYGHGTANFLGLAPGVNDREVNPLLADTGANNYHLTAASPAIDTAEGYPSPPLIDNEGRQRPQNLGYDIGAYEFHDMNPPVLLDHHPGDGAAGVFMDTQIWTQFHDENPGIDAASAQFWLDGQRIANNALDITTYNLGMSVDITYTPPTFASGSVHTYSVTVADGDGNESAPLEATFTVELVPQTLYVPAQYATVQDAITAAQPGDTIEIAPGSYAGPLVFNPAKSGVTIAGHNAYITGSAPNAAVTINGATNVHISGLVVNSGAQGIVLNGDVAGARIERCQVANLTGPGIAVMGQGEVAIVNCLSQRNSNGVYIAPGAARTADVVLLNSTIAYNTNGVEVYASPLVARYNIIAFNTSNGFMMGENAPAPVLDYNCVAENGAAPATSNYGDVTPGVNDIQDDPLFAGAYDFTLQGTSPAVDAVPIAIATLPPAAPDVDLPGVGRPQGAAFDMGAYELPGGAPPEPLSILPNGGAGINVNGQPRDVVCAIVGGLPPFTVTVESPFAGRAEIVHADNSMRAFILRPLGDNQSFGKTAVRVRVADSSGKVFLSQGFMLHRLYATPRLTCVINNPDVDNLYSIGSGDLAGLTVTVPAGTVNAGDVPLTITVSKVEAGQPAMAEDRGDVLLFEPFGMAFSGPIAIAMPYSGAALLSELEGYRYCMFSGHWEYENTAGYVADSVLFETKNLSLHTIAAPSVFAKTTVGGRTVEAYRMVAWPAYPGAVADIVRLLGTGGNLSPYDDRYWRLFAFNPLEQGTGNPNTYYREGDESGFGLAYPMRPGQGFWLITGNSANVTIPGIEHPANEDFYTALMPGWNMLGNPYNFPVDWAGVETVLNGVTYAQGSLDPYNPLQGEGVLYYDPTDQRAMDDPAGDGYYETAVMEPFAAYWVYNGADSAVTLRIPYTARWVMETGQKTTFFARLMRKAGDLAADVVFADNAGRPPAPPGSGGSNPGASSASIGTEAAGGSGGCFVEAAAAGSGAWGCAALGMMLGLGALARGRGRKRS